MGAPDSERPPDHSHCAAPESPNEVLAVAPLDAAATCLTERPVASCSRDRGPNGRGESSSSEEGYGDDRSGPTSRQISLAELFLLLSVVAVVSAGLPRARTDVVAGTLGLGLVAALVVTAVIGRLWRLARLIWWTLLAIYLATALAATWQVW